MAYPNEQRKHSSGNTPFMHAMAKEMFNTAIHPRNSLIIFIWQQNFTAIVIIYYTPPKLINTICKLFINTSKTKGPPVKEALCIVAKQLHSHRQNSIKRRSVNNYFEKKVLQIYIIIYICRAKYCIII